MKTLLLAPRSTQIQIMQRNLAKENLPVGYKPIEEFANVKTALLPEIVKLIFYDYHAIILYKIERKMALQMQALLREIYPKKLMILFDDDFEKENFNLFNQGIFDWYATKPFNFTTISLKIRNEVYRKNEGNSPDSILVCNEMKLDMEKRVVFFKNQSYFLRNKEFELLRFFLENKGKVLTRHFILENVWDMNASLFTNTIDVHVSRLRKLFKYFQIRAPYIETIPCTGYILQDCI